MANAQIDPVALQQTMRQFAAHSERMEMTEEMMGDLIDDFDGVEDEEVDEYTSQVLSEVASELTTQVRQAERRVRLPHPRPPSLRRRWARSRCTAPLQPARRRLPRPRHRATRPTRSWNRWWRACSGEAEPTPAAFRGHAAVGACVYICAVASRSLIDARTCAFPCPARGARCGAGAE